jgi:hypothetical protein
MKASSGSDCSGSASPVWWKWSLSGGIVAVGLVVPWAARLIVESRYAESTPGWSHSLFRDGDLAAGVWNALPFAVLAVLAWLTGTVPRSWREGGLVALPKVCAVAVALLALLGFSLLTNLETWSTVILQKPGWSTASLGMVFGMILSFPLLVVAYALGYATGWLARGIVRAFG